jgi:hypothetical protein
LAAALPLSATLAVADDYDLRNGVSSSDVGAGSLGTNFGNAVCTAAINSTGTVAGGASVNKSTAQTRRVGTGLYEVDFLAPCSNVTAKAGFARYVQVDTLQIGTAAPVICTTADRVGDTSSVWVACYDVGGVARNTSFFLTVTR